MPGDGRDKDGHTVMWDYNVGFVRITAFFKSLKHTKVRNSLMGSAHAQAYTPHLDNAGQSDERKSRAP